MAARQEAPVGRHAPSNPRTLFGLLGSFLRPIVYLSHNPISRGGVVLVTSSGITLVLAYLFQLFGIVYNPYAGLIVFLILPAVFLIGLFFIPTGICGGFTSINRDTNINFTATETTM